MIPRYPKTVRRRIAFLLLGNLLLLAGIALMLKQGASFRSILVRTGPDIAPTVLAGLGLTGIIFTGAIDLSIASILAVSATLFGILVHHQAPPLVAYLACLGSAISLSCLNSWGIRKLKVPAIILTLAGLAFYRGLALILADVGIENFSGNLSVHDPRYHLPGKVYSGWILAFALLMAFLWETHAKTPRMWMALGSNPDACRLKGANPDPIFFTSFLVGGFFLGTAALVYVTRLQAIEPARIALGFELQVIGAVILGGTHIFGGEGSYLGTLLGALFLYFLSQILTYANVNPYLQEAVSGALILLVIGLDCALHRTRKRMEELT